MLLSLALLFGAIFLYKTIMGFIGHKFMMMYMNPAITVSTSKVDFQAWQPLIRASGTIRAVNGVDVTTEIAGLVRSVHFVPGQEVKKGDLLVELNDDYEVAQLESFAAAVTLAKLTYNRDKILLTKQSVSKSTLDADQADLDGKQANVQGQEATIAKKRILAPFDGILGISVINSGQYLNPGDKIVTLQALDTIFVDFYVPQQSLSKIKLGQEVILLSDTYPDKTFEGKITTIEPKVDPVTRNVLIEATIANPNHLLLPGMFSKVEVKTGETENYLTLPQTAVSFNPYGEIVFVISESPTEKDKKTGRPALIANQSFVTTGETRGDQIAILKGLKKGDTVVTSGQLKLKNGSRVVINNTVTPSDNPKPDVVLE